VHLAGPCGEPGCSVDAKLSEASPRRRAVLALEWYISMSGEWARNAKARAVLERLAPAERARLSRLSATLYGGRGRPSWRSLLSAIAADQVIFESIIRGKRSSRLAGVADDFKTNAARVRRVYEAYRKQASVLREEWWPNSKEARALLRQFGPPPTPREPAPAPMEWPEVYHWFAHALRNLCRFRDNHPKLPWSPKCATRCLLNRDRLSAVRRPIADNCD
jgi:hypothetical protein